jgi:hypothetical protein
MGILQDCVVLNGRYFCWDTEISDVVEVKMERVNAPIEKCIREEAVKAVAMRRWASCQSKDKEM